MKKYAIILLAILIANSALIGQQSKTKRMDEMWGDEGKNNVDLSTEKSKQFDYDNYAMFIHWGLYSFLENKWNGKSYYGISEWLMNPRRANIAPKDYMPVAKKFNPVNFDAKKIVSIAKNAGMKYIVVTSKHHDGFAMYDSKSNDFNIVKQTPFARDPMKELASECKKQGLGFGFYYSHNQDWTFPGGAGGSIKNEKGEEVDFEYYYKKKCLPQVKEITTEYGDIRVVWFDTPGKMPKKYVEELVRITEKNQPNAMVSGRAGHGLGHYNSLGDMEVPLANVGSLWESVDVTNDSWGFAWYDKNWKSPKSILERLLSTVARGGTYMLNVGPDPTGLIPEMAAKSLEVSGAWIKNHPDLVYGAGPSPWGKALPWGDVTTQGNVLNCIVYEWPTDSKLYLPSLTEKDIEAITLYNGKELDFENYGQGVIIRVPDKSSEKLYSVIKVICKSEKVEVDQTISLDPEFSVPMHVLFADANDKVTLKNRRWMEKFGEWKSAFQAQNWKDGGEVSWDILVPEAGVYDIKLKYTGEGRLIWKITSDEGEFVQNEQASSSIYVTKDMGWMKFTKPGKHKLTVSLVSGEKVGLVTAFAKRVEF